jgi:hypothetical protein
MATRPASENPFPEVLLSEVAAPSAAPTGKVRLYAKSDGLLYWKDDAGTEHAVGTGDLAGHTGDTTDAHDASAISADTTGFDNAAGDDVQEVLGELDAAITAAGGGATDDTIPVGGTLYAGTATTGWTAFGSGGLTTFDADTTVPGALYLRKASTGGNNDYGVSRAISSLPRTITAKLKAVDAYQNYHGAGIMVGDSTPSAHTTWGITHDTASVAGRLLQRYAWTSPTSAGAATGYPGSSSPGLTPSIPLWLRLVVNSSTDIEYWASWDGYLYFRFAAAINPGFTVATFGAFIFGFGIDMRAAFDWIHES